jgi:nitroreductase
MSDQPEIPAALERVEPEEMIARARALRTALETRRSVRDFAPEPVPHEVVEDVLAIAASAPSGANLQPWHFVVVTDQAVKHEIRSHAEEIERDFYANRISDEWRDALEPLDLDVSKPFLDEAPVLIVVFRRNHVVDEEGESHKTYYPMESTGIATGFLIAALHQVGLASVPYTPAPMGFLRELLGRPESDHPFLVLAVGYPADNATTPALEREPLERVATFIEGRT